jgi:hypothetical protein
MPRIRTYLIYVSIAVSLCGLANGGGTNSLESDLRDNLVGAIEVQGVYEQMYANPLIARKVVRNLLATWPTQTVATRCMVVLERLGQKEDAMRVLPFLVAPGDGFIRWRALLVVTAHGDYRILSSVETCLYDDNESVRQVAIDYLEKQKNKWSGEAFHRFLEFQPKNDEMKKDQDRVRAILNKIAPNKK